MEMNKHQISHVSQQVLDLLSGNGHVSSSGDVEMKLSVDSFAQPMKDE